MKYISLFCCAFLLASCGTNTSNKPGGTDSVSNTAKATSAASISNFSLLKGSIGEYPVTLYLFALQHKYSGYYYYDSQQQPISISGYDTANQGTLELTAYGSNDSSETFSLVWNGQKATGTWKMGGQSLPVSLAPANLPISFDYVGVVDSVRLTDTLPKSPVATARAATVWPKGSTATDNFIKQQIAFLFNKTQPQTDVNALLQADTKQFLADYKSDSNDITLEDVKTFPEALNYALDNDLSIAYLTPKLLMLSFSNYSYTGGAHGNFGTTYLPLDIQHNKVLQLKDILTPQGIKQLRPLLESSHRKDLHLKPSQSLSTDGDLFENKVEPNNNFYVTGKGLIFSYQPYEIGPYAVGEIVIMISYESLQNYLQPGFKELLQ